MKLKNNALQELYETIVNGNPTILPYAESPIDKAFRECDEKLQKDIDIWRRFNEFLRSANTNLDDDKRKLEKEIEGLKEHILEDHKNIADINSERDALEKERDDLLSRTHCAEDEVEELKIELHTAEEARDNIRAELEAKVKRMDEITKDRDFFFRVYHALKNDYEKLEAKYRDMKSYSKCYAEGYSDGKEEGEENLWDKLQNVNDSQPYDFDAECDGMEDVISMDLEDFLDTYKKWQEEKEKNRLDHMRDYLARFCEGRVCEACPLGSTKYKCGCGYSFKKATVWDSKIIPDEELKKYYEKARGCGKLFIHDLSHPMAGVNEAIKENIARNSRECTFEATVEVNKDLLEKVCGIKLGEEEHKLEYGDAVRVSWSNFDYMYIGPDEHRIRLFDPKYRCVIFVSSTEKLTYQGSKIIICDEEDLRKIWKDKK